MKGFIVSLVFLLSNSIFSQSASYSFTRPLNFPVADSLVSPYLCTVDAKDNLWVVSTNLSSASAQHSLFMAAPKDTVLKLIKVFGSQDSIRNITGIAAIGSDIFITSRMEPYTGAADPYYYPYSQMFYLPEGNVSKIKIFKKPGYWDYGTWYTAITSTKDGFIYFGQSYLISVGSIDGRKDSSSFGNVIDYARIDWSTAMEPGGGFSYPNAMDLIRDIAVLPGGNYNDTTTVIYTSRNSSSDPGGDKTGGIAIWTGGKQTSPLTYHSKRLSDLSGFLSLKNSTPYGIAINPKNNNLFVCGSDSSKVWVKGFQVTGNFAIQADELPSKTSMDVKDPKGAPFISPADVAFSQDGTAAYVADQGAKKVFKFQYGTTDVKDNHSNLIKTFQVNQNYPNPFNPSTNIVVELPSSGRLKAEVYNVLGQKVAILADKEVSSGKYTLQFTAERFSSGIYICKVSAGEFSQTIKMMLKK